MRPKSYQIIQESVYESKGSLSLDDNSVIEEYGGLDFSDEKSNDQFSSESAHQLSNDKLQFLGVQHFPNSYAHRLSPNSPSKLNQTDTKEESNIMRDTAQFKHIQPRRKSSRQRVPVELLPSSDQPAKKVVRRDFDIDNFLNAGPVATTYSKYSKPIREHRRDSNTNKLQRSMRQQKQHWGDRKRVFQMKPTQLPQISDQDQESLTLITLPEPEHRGRRAKSVKGQVIVDDQFQIRLESAKINFMDCFLPEGMKIGNNPFRFWKYANSKQSSFCGIR